MKKTDQIRSISIIMVIIYALAVPFTMAGTAQGVDVSDHNADEVDTTSVPGSVIYKWTNVTASGSITFSSPGEVEYLVVGGGGGGGNIRNGRGSGGGGGGGVLTGSTTVSAQPYTIKVGAGGTGPSSQLLNGNPGVSSFFGVLEAGGGGAGVGSNAAYPADGGGSGGGGCGVFLDGRPAGTLGIGFAGGNGFSVFTTGPGGGGGGAGLPGVNATSSKAGDGGYGVPSSITGTEKYYGGGGGGGAGLDGTSVRRGIGSGLQGGGSDGGYGAVNPVSATPNTGGGMGGGGGGGLFNLTGIRGGSGIVIIRYEEFLPPVGTVITIQ